MPLKNKLEKFLYKSDEYVYNSIQQIQIAVNINRERCVFMQIYDEIPYVEDGQEENIPQIELYKAENKKSDTLMLICPGGAYCWLAPHEGEGYAKYFSQIGIDCAVLKYRIYPPYSYPCQLLDARRAVRFLKAKKEELGLDFSKIILVGSSAGGHLAALTATYHSIDKVDEAEGKDEIDKISPHIDGLVLAYPVLSMGAMAHEGSRKVLLDKANPEELPMLKDNLSVEKSAGRDMPPLFMWACFDDSCVDVRNSIMLASRYRELNLDCEMHLFSGGSHGMGIADYSPQVNQWVKLCKTWLIEHGFLSE